MSEIVSALPFGMRPEVTRRRIEVFRKRFGNAHLYLAYHAAFPIALTPDLVYRLRANFQRDVYSELLNIPWIAVADLLLSSLCEEVGYELYEMNVAVRNELLSQLRKHEDFGELRISELSNFLLKYVRQQLDSHDPDTRDFAHAQYWTALVATRPEEAAHSIALTLSKLDPRDRAGFARMKSLIATLGEPSDEFATLLAYTKSMEQYARGNEEQARVALDTASSQTTKRGRSSVDVRGVGLPIPQGLWSPTEEAGEPPLSKTPIMSEPAVQTDCLISYHDTDNDWAIWIKWQIEEAGYSVALQPWNFQPDANFAVEMEKATRISNRIIILYSQNYLNALSKMPGWNVAFLQTPNQGRGLLLPIRINDCDPDTLLGPTDYLDLVGLDVQEAQELIRQFAHRKLEATKPLADAGHGVEHAISEQPALPSGMFPQAQPIQSQQKPAQAIEIFIAYAREDRGLRDELERYLTPLKREGLIDVWHDREISAGAEWEQEIKQHLNDAQIILLLVSPDFMNSEYCYSIEMKRALERHAKDEAKVIPVILRPVYWHGEPLGKLQALPTDGQPVTSSSWRNRDEAFFEVMVGLRAVIEKLRKTVFIVYSRADGEFVTRLKNDLESTGITTTGLEGIQIGTPDWEKATQIAIRSADAVLYIASPDARQSHYVRDELRIAEVYQRPVYPIWAAGTVRPDTAPLGLGDSQYIDARGERYEIALHELIEALGVIKSPAKSIIEAEKIESPAQAATIPTPAPSEETPAGSKSRRLIPNTELSYGRYKIERLVAAGGMGAVYLATDQRFNRPCAVKEMLDDFQNDSERTQAIEWFRREATLLLDLKHPCIPSVRDFFDHNGKNYLVMDFIEGRTLADVFAKEGNVPGLNGARGVSEARARNWARQICSVLAYLHSQNPPIIFRDLKPSNIMVTSRDEIKLIDFGIARTFQSQRQSSVIMTIGYAPPEQMQGRAEPRSDLFALGATIHRVLTQHDPVNNKPSLFDFPPVRMLRPDVSVAFNNVIMRALEANVGRRWSSVAEMERAIINLPPIPATTSVEPISSDTIPPQGQPYSQYPQTLYSALDPQTPYAVPAVSDTTSGPAGSFITAAQRHIDANRVEEAYVAIQQAYKLEPNNALVHRIYGQVFARRQPPAPDLAIQAYNHSLQLNPSDAETHRLVGDVFLYLRKVPLQAIQPYIQSLRLNPKDVEAHLRLAQSYEETQQFEPALREYQEAALLAPKQAVLHVKLGQLATRLKQLALAERAFVTALTLNPADFQTRFLLSQVYEEEGKLQDAERECGYVGSPKNKDAQAMLERLHRQ